MEFTLFAGKFVGLKTKPLKGISYICKRLDIVKHIINLKINEQNTKLIEKSNAEKRQRILEIINKKDEESLENMSKEELEKLLSNIN